MSKFSMTIESRNDWTVVRLGGAITEEAGVRLLQLYTDAGKNCVFNMADVTAINSNGIRAWVLFIRTFQTDRTLELEECAPVVVDQMNMLPSFTAKVHVRSVQAPYECTGCNVITNVVVAARDFPPPSTTPKPIRCKQCHGQAVIVDGSDYFDFAAE